MQTTASSPRKPKVLVIGDDTRSFLTSVRSLGRQGIEVHAAPYTLGSPALASRYVSKIHLLPYYLDGGAQWLQAMQQILATEHYDMVLPCEERSLLPLFMHQQALPAETVLAIPHAVGLDAFFDKVNTRALAAQVGVPVAKGFVPSPGDTPAQVVARLAFPMIAKFKKSYALPDLYVRTGVEIIRTAQALDQWWVRGAANLGDMYFEEIFEGTGLGVSVLCHRGQVLQAFEHHRVNELAGSSYYRKSMPVDPQRLAAVQRMVDATAYTGLGMFEFKLNPQTQTWVLLEVNARPWGSMPLPVALKIDFPYRLYRLLCHGDTAGQQLYRSPVYGRNVIADVWQLRAQAAAHQGRKAAFLKHLMGWAAGFGRVLIAREHHDVFVWDDPRPGLLEAKQFVAERLQALRGKQPLTPNAALATLLARGARSAAPHVVFLCQGNICRSPYAELKARLTFAQAGVAATVESAGMLPRNHRPSPPTAVAAAAQLGVDLAPHVSQHAFADVIDRASLIVVFDTINYRACLARYPGAAQRLVYLGEFEGSGTPHPQEIADPDGKSLNTFITTYQHIDGCVHGLTTFLKNHAPA